MNEDEPDSPSRQENITPLGSSTDPEILQQILASINSLKGAIQTLQEDGREMRRDMQEMRRDMQEMRRDIQENQKQIQDLNALFIRTTSPLGRGDRSQSPAAM